MDAQRHQWAEGIIYEPVPAHARQATEGFARDANAEVPALARTRMAGVQVAVVLHLETLWRQGGAQGALDVFAADVHAHDPGDQGDSGGCPTPCSTGLTCRPRYTPWASVNSSIRPMLPKSLKLTQVAVEKV